MKLLHDSFNGCSVVRYIFHIKKVYKFSTQLFKSFYKMIFSRNRTFNK